MSPQQGVPLQLQQAKAQIHRGVGGDMKLIGGAGHGTLAGGLYGDGGFSSDWGSGYRW